MAVWSVIKVSDLYTGNRLGAEFYHPDKLKALELLKNRSTQSIRDFFKNVRKILNPSTTEKIFIDPTFVFDLSDIEDYFLGEGLQVKDTAEVGSAKKIFRPGDVLISRLRSYLQEIAFVDHEGTLLGSTEFIVLRKKQETNIPAEYLFVFLMTKEVQDVLLWSQEGTNHPRFQDSVLLDLPLPEIDESTKAQIIELVRKANQAFRNSQQSFLQSMAIVREELQWDQLDSSQPKYWTVSCSRANEVHRLDAEYYQPKYNSLLASLYKFNCHTLDGLTKRISTGKTPAKEEYSLEGIPILKVEGLGSTGIIEIKDACVPESWAKQNRKGEVRKGDAFVLCAAHHQSYIGKTGLLMDSLSPLTRAVGELIILRFNENVAPEFICTYLNLDPVKLLMQRLCRGNTAHLYPNDLASLPVPELSPSSQMKIVELFRQSYKAHIEAKVLLDEAKIKAESAINLQ